VHIALLDLNKCHFRLLLTQETEEELPSGILATPPPQAAAIESVLRVVAWNTTMVRVARASTAEGLATAQLQIFPKGIRKGERSDIPSPAGLSAVSAHTPCIRSRACCSRFCAILNFREKLASAGDFARVARPGSQAGGRWAHEAVATSLDCTWAALVAAAIHSTVWASNMIIDLTRVLCARSSKASQPALSRC